MPARHDLLVGALDFLWRPWGSIEIWEDAITYDLQRAGVTTMLVSDHPHLFEIGGENYHTDFTAWLYERGHESDPWRTRPDPTWTGTPALPAEPGFVHHAYDDSRTWFRAEGDFPGPRTMQAAEQWLRTSARRPRPLPAVRRRVRSARAVRHARAVGDQVRPGVGRPAAHLAAVLHRDDREGPAATGRGPADPRELPVEAGDDRPLARAHPRRARRSRVVGRHRVRALHRSRPLPRRARCLRQARHPGVRRSRSHAAAHRVAGRRAGRGRRAHDERRSARDLRRRVRCRARAPHARPFARAADPRRDRLGARARAARLLGAPRPRRRHGTALRARARRRELPPRHVVEPVVDDADPRPARAAAPAARPARRARVHARLRRARHPPTLHGGRLPAVLGLRRGDRSAPAARSRHRSVADPQPRRHRGREGSRRPLARRARRDRSAHRAVRTPRPHADPRAFVREFATGTVGELTQEAHGVTGAGGGRRRTRATGSPRRTRRRRRRRARAGPRPLPASAGATLRVRASR